MTSSLDDDVAGQTIFLVDGELWFLYGVEYGSPQMTFHFWAKSRADAERRLEAIQDGASVYGSIIRLID